MIGRKVTKEGYEQLARAILEKQEEILGRSRQMSEFFRDETGSDTVSQAYAVALNEINLLAIEQRRMEDDLNGAVIVDEVSLGEEIVSIGDVFTLESLNEQDKGERETYQLSAQLASLMDDLGQTVSINCDMGKSVLGRKVGDIIEYEVKDPRGLYNAKFKYRIVGLVKQTEDEKEEDIQQEQPEEEQGQKKQIVLPNPIQPKK